MSASSPTSRPSATRSASAFASWRRWLVRPQVEVLRRGHRSLGLAFTLAAALVAWIAVPAGASVHGSGRGGGLGARPVRVAVLNVDPVVAAEGGRRVHEVLGWNDPHVLAAAYRDDVRRASSRQLSYQVTLWRDVEDIPVKEDGFRYTVTDYLAAWRAGTGFHEPDIIDYPRMLVESGLIGAINRGKIDEVWLYGAPYFGYWEAAMAGPGAFFVNGGVYPDVPGLTRPVVIMGFSYEREVGEELHDLCHRIEATMTRIYGGWNLANPVTAWDSFGRNVIQSPAPTAVGTCHFPPNARYDYDYSNPEPILSTAQNWLRYPRLRSTGTAPVSSQTWSVNGDDHRGFMIWWMQHLPHAPGWNADGRLNNWWRYVVDYARYDSSGRPLR